MTQALACSVTLRCLHDIHEMAPAAPGKRSADEHGGPLDQDVVGRVPKDNKKTACPSKDRYIRYIGSGEPKIIRYTTVTLPLHPLHLQMIRWHDDGAEI